MVVTGVGAFWQTWNCTGGFPLQNTELLLYSENTRVDSFQMGTNTVFIFSRARGEHRKKQEAERWGFRDRLFSVSPFITLSLDLFSAFNHSLSAQPQSTANTPSRGWLLDVFRWKSEYDASELLKMCGYLLKFEMRLSCDSLVPPFCLCRAFQTWWSFVCFLLEMFWLITVGSLSLLFV